MGMYATTYISYGFGLGECEVLPWQNDEHPDFEKHEEDGFGEYYAFKTGQLPPDPWESWDEDKMREKYPYEERQIKLEGWIKEHEAELDAWRAKKKEIQGTCNVDSGHCGMSDWGSDAETYIYIESSQLGFDWDGVETLDLAKLEIEPEWDEQLKAACEMVGIEYRPPQWIVAVTYG